MHLENCTHQSNSIKICGSNCILEGFNAIRRLSFYGSSSGFNAPLQHPIPRTSAPARAHRGQASKPTQPAYSNYSETEQKIPHLSPRHANTSSPASSTPCPPRPPLLRIPSSPLMYAPPAAARCGVVGSAIGGGGAGGASAGGSGRGSRRRIPARRGLSCWRWAVRRPLAVSAGGLSNVRAPARASSLCPATRPWRVALLSVGGPAAGDPCGRRC